MQSDRGIHPLLAGRRSPRAFDAQQVVARADVESVLEAARWSPSCFNEQPWRYIVCDRHTDPRAWQDMLGCLVEGNQRWAKNAPVFIAVLTRVQPDDPAAARVAFYDTGAASLSMCLQAHSMGLAAHQIGGFDAQAVQRAFVAPEGMQPMAVIALGYPGDLQQLDERTRAKELAPRQRRAIRDFAAFGREPIPS